MKLSYAVWYTQVTRVMLSIAGVVPEDIEDYGYADAHNRGRSPVAVAKAALKNAGF